MAAEPERKYGVLGELHYYVESELDEEDGHYQWTVTVLLADDHEEVAGWYWYDDNEIVVQALDPFQPLDEHLAKVEKAIRGGPETTYEVALTEEAAVARILRGWDDVELVEED